MPGCAVPCTTGLDGGGRAAVLPSRRSPAPRRLPLERGMTSPQPLAQRSGPPAGGARRPRRIFVTGMLCGVIATAVLRFTINNTTIADHLVAPLITSDTTGPGDAIVVPGAGVS